MADQNETVDRGRYCKHIAYLLLSNYSLEMAPLKSLECTFYKTTLYLFLSYKFLQNYHRCYIFFN